MSYAVIGTQATGDFDFCEGVESLAAALAIVERELHRAFRLEVRDQHGQVVLISGVPSLFERP